MRAFAELFAALDETTKTLEKVAALMRYFETVPAAEAAWALFFLSGRRLPKPVPSPRLRKFATELAQVQPWLFDECYDAVGDLAETIALLIPAATSGSDRPLDEWVHDWLIPLRQLDEQQQRERLVAAWRELSVGQLFVWNKLLTGSFRVGVSQQLVVRALAHVSGVSSSIISHRLMGEWSPTPESFTRLMAVADVADDASKPYPFFLAHPLLTDAADLGKIDDWQLEWKWDGIRCQLLRRRGQTFLWSRGEELLTDRFPEVVRVGDHLADGTVLDGEILPFKNNQLLPFLDLQQRITRKTVSKSLLNDVPVIFMAYDLLEEKGIDLRAQPMRERRLRLESISRDAKPEAPIQISPTLTASSWLELGALRQQSRERHVEGIMLKRLDSPYRNGRQRGDWWKWKIDPYTLDAVLISAQPGSGKRANLYTDYTFGLWDDGQLVAFAKAYSGLTDEEIGQVDAFVRKNTLAKFGPVRTVKPTQVFELAFEGIQYSARHRSGVAVRFPRILRWRTDKAATDADSLQMALAMISARPDRPVSRKGRGKDLRETPLFDGLEEE